MPEFVCFLEMNRDISSEDIIKRHERLNHDIETSVKWDGICLNVRGLMRIIARRQCRHIKC